jgi:hypothetical protein
MDDKTLAALGGLINSALYLAGLLAASLVFHDKHAVVMTLCAIGVTYVSYGSHYGCLRGAHITGMISNILGFAAGLMFAVNLT